MKTLSVAVPASVVGAIKTGDSVILKAGLKSVTLRVVSSSTWKRPTKAQLKAFCEAANRRDTAAERGFMESIFPW